MKKVLVLLILCIFLCGCVPTLSNLQRRNIEAKELQGSFEDAFRASMAVLQDRGYAIKHTDYEAGVIHAETGLKRGFWGNYNFIVTATIEPFGENRVKERIAFVQTKVVDAGYYGRSENTKIIEDAELLQQIYDEIQKEIFVRQNLAK